MNNNNNQDELYHYGVLGMKWGIRKKLSASRGIKKANKLLRKYTKAGNAYAKTARVYQVGDNNIIVGNTKKKIKGHAAFKKLNDQLQRTTESLRGSDYAIGYDAVKDMYSLRKVDPKTGKDYWTMELATKELWE